MARLPRIVLPGVPDHVTQRGSRRERTFFEDGNYGLYLDLLAEAALRHGVEIWAYCQIPNHVHIIAVPRDADALDRAFRHVHRHYTGHINARLRVTGHLWQGRFSSVAMDEQHLYDAFRYVALNPVRARLAARAEDWPGRAPVRTLQAMTAMSSGWRLHWNGSAISGLSSAKNLMRPVLTPPCERPRLLGGPVGSPDWLEDKAAKTGLSILPGKRGPKSKTKG